MVFKSIPLTPNHKRGIDWVRKMYVYMYVSSRERWGLSMVTHPSSGAKAGSQAQEALKERRTVNRACPDVVDVPQGHLFEWWSIFFNSLNGNTEKEQSEPALPHIFSSGMMIHELSPSLHLRTQSVSPLRPSYLSPFLPVFTSAIAFCSFLHCLLSGFSNSLRRSVLCVLRCKWMDLQGSRLVSASAMETGKKSSAAGMLQQLQCSSTTLVSTILGDPGSKSD
ncbi:hypothetical protein PIB30_071533 [Stylosanthes scabra]|uniref:Uncharacterized protein n=1 Tax=Stylosanthes scabra TaxID=79078 RepID=A0ABU6TNZ5_9FABA|nr:hypothetical protein [Stylosanthes scabra]